MATGSAWAHCRSERGALFRTYCGRRPFARLARNRIHEPSHRTCQYSRRQKMTKILEATSFGATSTTDEVLSGMNLKGKRILVTGASAGLGVETARSLAAHGA